MVLSTQALVGREASASRDETAHGDILLEPTEVIDLAADGRLGEDPSGLLEDAEMKESVEREAFVIPRRLGSADRRLETLLDECLVGRSEDSLVDRLIDQEVRIARGRPNATQHLANDDLDVLVVDLHTLEMTSWTSSTGSSQAASRPSLSGGRGDWWSHPSARHQSGHSALAHGDVLALRDEVLSGLAHPRG